MLRFGTLVLALFLATASVHVAAAQERRLLVVAPWELSSIDPSKTGYIFQRMGVAESLVAANDDGELIPGLAEAWQVSDDGLTWRFDLPEGAVFHDGSPVTGDAVVQALRIALEKPGVLANVPLEGMEALDGALRIRTEKPFPALPAFLAHYSTVILAPTAYDRQGNAVTMIGSGPYRVEAMQAPQSMDAQRFARWRGEPPAIEFTRYLAVGRGETRMLMLESGQAHLAFTLPPANMARLRRNPDLVVETVTIPRTMAMKVNAGHPALDSAEARQALSLLIDRAGIASAILRNPDQAATQLFSPSLAGWHDPELPPLAHDPARAKAILRSLGWQPGPDGVLQRDGRRLALTLRTFPTRPELPTVAAALQEQFRQAGIVLDVSIGNYSEIAAGHQDGSLDLGLMARNFGLVPNPLGTLLSDFGPGGGDWGAMNWQNESAFQALDALSQEQDAARAAVLRQELVGTLQAELPVIPIAWYSHQLAYNRRVQGVSIDPLELSYRIENMSWAN